MNKNDIHITFPIVALMLNNTDIYVFTEKEKKNLHYSTMKSLESGSLNGTIMIDSLGNQYTVKTTHFRKYRGLWGYTLTHSGKGQIIIDYEFEPEVKNISLEDFKELLLKRSYENIGKPYWDEMYDVRELKNAIKKASSYEEVIMIFH